MIYDVNSPLYRNFLSARIVSSDAKKKAAASKVHILQKFIVFILFLFCFRTQDKPEGSRLRSELVA